MGMGGKSGDGGYLPPPAPMPETPKVEDPDIQNKLAQEQARRIRANGMEKENISQGSLQNQDKQIVQDKKPTLLGGSSAPAAPQ